MPGLARFTLRVEPDGTVACSVNGEAQPWVQAFSIYARPGGVPLVQLEAAGDVELEGEGVVRIAADPEGLTAGDLAALLDALDPDEVDREALAGLGLGDQGGTAAILAWLKGHLCPT